MFYSSGGFDVPNGYYKTPEKAHSSTPLDFKGQNIARSKIAPFLSLLSMVLHLVFFFDFLVLSFPSWKSCFPIVFVGLCSAFAYWPAPDPVLDSESRMNFVSPTMMMNCPHPIHHHPCNRLDMSLLRRDSALFHDYGSS
eukprot:TRINITY_DN487_c0_g1_i1.p1 TRINITY_DN487_c0_g1~~TRINITY_DN487_c0_g1_i1.p1  ORF type:complete len:139 (+),score=6.53 TRINITY_DN487_c0_g1_i1:48-464(+)